MKINSIVLIMGACAFASAWYTVLGWLDYGLTRTREDRNFALLATALLALVAVTARMLRS